MTRETNRGNPMIYHYLKRYQEDPTSRIFAPLAEAYRKAGMIDDAIEICRDGLRIHPHFVGGRVALARAFFDKGQYADVVKEIEPIVLDSPDNLIAQKLLAESHLILGNIAAALNAFKVLLFFQPDDFELQKMVSELEERAYEEGALVLVDDPVQLSEYREAEAQHAISTDPEVKRKEWINKIERLQGMLLKVQRIKLADRR